MPFLKPGDQPLLADEQPPVFNQRSGAFGLTITSVLAWLCTLLRLYVRFRIIGSPWWDDLFVLLAMMSATSGSVVFCLCMPAALLIWLKLVGVLTSLEVIASYNMGKHITSLSLDDANSFMKVFYIGSISYPVALMTIKLALLFQYLRIFPNGSRRRLICKYLIGFISVWGIFFCIPIWVPCLPVRAMWDLSPESIATRRCWGLYSPHLAQVLGFYVTQSVSTAFLDLVIFLLPLHLFFQSGTETRTRIALVGLLLLGLCVNVCSIGRLVYSVTPTLDAMWDLSWNSPTPTGLAALEINLASICAALPVFWPVVQDKWAALVTYEVTVASEPGIYMRKRKDQQPRKSGDSGVELRLAPSEALNFEATEWDPNTWTSMTGMGDSETVIESRPASVRNVKRKRSFAV